ncbi:hypothetical protein MFIFM68171_03297 [Madurella fahalii]|uniref:Protein kinase domain-containing protein n=1 Tax=Madurella fahalii TaxID=1157608 RepID=A0ABQ0G5Q0_9PEZI
MDGNSDDSVDKIPPPRSLPIQIPRFRIPGEPDRYRLRSARIERPFSGTAQIPISFWFRTRYVVAEGTILDSCHPDILQLSIQHSAVSRVVSSFCALLPSFLQSAARIAFPEWFLPDRIILKSQKRHEDIEELVARSLFDTEVEAYNRLKPLQGLDVPICYGRVQYNGQRALLLEHLGGSSLASVENMLFDLDELADLLQAVYQRLQTVNVQQDDPQLGNYQVVVEHGKKRLKALDFERVSFDPREDDENILTKNHIEELIWRYRCRRKYFRMEGLLEAA